MKRKVTFTCISKFYTKMFLDYKNMQELNMTAALFSPDCNMIHRWNIWQVEEEIGINLNANEMIDLTQLLDPSTGCRTFPSPVCLY